jgi:hypothetical protein
VIAELLGKGGGNADTHVLATRLVERAYRVGASAGNFLGRNSARAFELIRRGKPLEETGAGSDTTGAAMRWFRLASPFPSVTSTGSSRPWSRPASDAPHGCRDLGRVPRRRCSEQLDLVRTIEQILVSHR